MAGWIWNHNPLVNFAELGSDAYLRRQIVIWGDSIKLRYGGGPADNPELWAYMAAYTARCVNVSGAAHDAARVARLFDGLRVDNCHSTPIHVGQHLLDVARAANPNLLVVRVAVAVTKPTFRCRLRSCLRAIACWTSSSPTSSASTR